MWERFRRVRRNLPVPRQTARTRMPGHCVPPPPQSLFPKFPRSLFPNILRSLFPKFPRSVRSPRIPGTLFEDINNTRAGTRFSGCVGRPEFRPPSRPTRESRQVRREKAAETLRRQPLRIVLVVFSQPWWNTSRGQSLRYPDSSTIAPRIGH